MSSFEKSSRYFLIQQLTQVLTRKRTNAGTVIAASCGHNKEHPVPAPPIQTPYFGC